MYRDYLRKQKDLEDGHAFEEFVANLFDQSVFTLTNTRPDRKVGRHIVESNGDPDQEWELKHAGAGGEFAVECKFRRNWQRGSGDVREVVWCKQEQLDRYRRFAQEKHKPVFVVIGLGPEPTRPDRLYTIPLERAVSPILTERQLAPFAARSSHEKFTYLPNRRVLTQNGHGIHDVDPSPAPNVVPPSKHQVVSPASPDRPLLQRQLPRTAPPRPPTYIVVRTEPRRRGGPTALLGLVFIVLLAVTFLHSRKIVPVGNDGAAQAPHDSSFESAPRNRPPPTNNEPPVSTTSGLVQPSTLPTTNSHARLHYKRPERMFNLTIESREAATSQQLERASVSASKALGFLAESDVPPFLAIETLPDDRYPRLRALMLFDTSTHQFLGRQIFISVADIAPGTCVKIDGRESLFVGDGTW